MKEGVGKAIEYGKSLKCPRINCLAGLTPKDAPADKVRQTLVNNLKFAADAMQKAGISLLVESLNSYDVAGFYLTNSAAVLQLIDEVNHPNLFYQYDIYHMQIMEGDLIATIRKNIKYIGHFHTAGVPGRHELDENQEIYYPAVMRAIVEAGYTGYVAHEYTPVRDPVESLVQAIRTCDV